MLLICGPTWPTLDFVKPGDSDSIAISDRFTIAGQPLFTCRNVGDNDLRDRLADDRHASKTAFTVWDSSLILAKTLEYEHGELARGGASALDLRGKRVIELGAGRAIVGMAAALLGGRVVITDIDEVVPALTQVIKLNDFAIGGTNDEVHGCIESVCGLDWSRRCASQTLGPPFDIVLAADVVWLEELIDPLVATIAELSGPSTRTFLAHQSRSTRGDESLFAALEDHELCWEVLPDHCMDPVYQKPTVVIYLIRRRALS